MTTRHNQTALTRLHQAILDVLWRGGPATADAVRQALLPAHPLKDSSVRTLLRRLEARGLVDHAVDGKVFVYRAKIRAPRLAARTVRHVIDRFWSGSAEQFLLGLVDEKVLRPEEIERLAKKIRSQKP